MCKETITIRIVEEDGSFLEYTRTTSIPVKNDYVERMREYEDTHTSFHNDRFKKPMKKSEACYTGDAVHQGSLRDIMDAIDEYIRNDRNFNY